MSNSAQSQQHKFYCNILSNRNLPWYFEQPMPYGKSKLGTADTIKTCILYAYILCGDPGTGD